MVSHGSFIFFYQGSWDSQIYISLFDDTTPTINNKTKDELLQYIFNQHSCAMPM